MKAAIYNPYFDTLGGGERYTMAVASALESAGYSVFIQWHDKKIKSDLEKRFGIDLKNINVVPDIKRGDGFDVCFWLSDGSIPMLRSRNNILHFQFPFSKVNGRSLMNKMKFYRINHVVCNSEFTKRFIDREYQINSKVIYPPVDVENIKPKRKTNTILYVGRFSSLTQSKHQDILIDAFKEMYDSGQKKYRMVLAGGVEIGVDKNVIPDLRKSAQGYPIRIVESPTYSKLLEYYGESKFFWSASGFGEDENLNPTKVEHFGITLVEAMAAGCVPLAYNAGGHKEIITGNEGVLWGDIDHLCDETKNLIKDKKLFVEYQNNAIKRSKDFSYENFSDKIKDLL